ncbi:hypothetical protein HPB50_027422 [Hyalomma asiaticum]|uniref:Uncharacterized protein n=1 Tax=Hyalomma asiaticum TaxID=266040 RepID=A0ACB7SIA8_HYAAI|nr:hypothetical protein HPB50_027422 [Hyalomma asiaticum]
MSSGGGDHVEAFLVCLGRGQLETTRNMQWLVTEETESRKGINRVPSPTSTRRAKMYLRHQSALKPQPRTRMLYGVTQLGPMPSLGSGGSDVEMDRRERGTLPPQRW